MGYLFGLGSGLILEILRSGLRGLNEANSGFELKIKSKGACETWVYMGLVSAFLYWVSQESFWSDLLAMYKCIGCIRIS